MKRNLTISIILSAVLLISGCSGGVNINENSQKKSDESIKAKQIAILNHLLKTYRSDKDEKPQDVPVWERWLRLSGELPPDFDKMPSNAVPPEILVFENGKKVTDPDQWPERKKEIRKLLQQYMFGNWPEPPQKMFIRYQERQDSDYGAFTIRNVQLYFAPSLKAVELIEKNGAYDHDMFRTALLNVQLYIPKGKGPFPVIIEVGPGRAQISAMDKERLKRGYMVCHYDRRDAEFIPGVYPDNDCNQLEWWAWAAGRCVDLLFTREDVDKTKIATAGHSRGGKTALLAAVMDERINAVIDSHPGTGAGTFNLWRYAGDKYGGETLEISTRQFPYWNNPRMRFFIGRENKLPFDSHFLLAMIAPRACLVSTGILDGVGEPWGDQQSYLAAKEVYKLLGNEKRLGFYASPGAHETTPVMITDYLDWLDMQFDKKPFTFNSQLIYSYTFDEWKKITAEDLNLKNFPEKDLSNILLSADNEEIKTRDAWESKAGHIKNQIKLVIGELPGYEKIQKAELENERKSENDLLKAEISINEKLVAHLTWPAKKSGKLPAVIYLHAYLDSRGYNWHRGYGYNTSVGERLAQNGFLAVEFDQFGYGQRNRDCGIEFYRENKDQSALGIMIQDVSKIIDALNLIDWVDKEKIMVSGYSLGGMVGLYSAVFDPRIKAVASICGFGSMRMDVHGNETEGLKRYSHLRPTIPRLGLFLGNEKRIPFDFHEVIGTIAPRPVFILAPKLDQDWKYNDVEICYTEAAKVYDLYKVKENIVLNSPDDFNRFPPEYQEMVINWMKAVVK